MCDFVVGFVVGEYDEVGFYDVLDVVWCIVGIGSLGLDCYVVLVCGDGCVGGG